MQFWVQFLLPVISAVMGSAGLWTYLNSKRQKKSDTEEAIIVGVMGLIYDQIVTRGMSYISRGSITKDEFEDFDKLFYSPYKALGGNGLAEQIYNQVKNLPFNNPQLYFELKQPRQEYSNDGWTTASGFNRTAIEQPRI